MENLDTEKTLAKNIGSSAITDPVFDAIKEYGNHPSMKNIKTSWVVLV